MGRQDERPASPSPEADPKGRASAQPDDPHSRLQAALAGLDWAGGVDKAALMAAVAHDDGLRSAIGQYLSEGHYDSPEAVATLIPEQAWQDAQGDTWHGGLPPDSPAANGGFAASPVAQDSSARETAAPREQTHGPPPAPNGDPIPSAPAAAEVSRGEAARQPIVSSSGVGQAAAAAKAAARPGDAARQAAGSATGAFGAATAAAQRAGSTATGAASRLPKKAASLVAGLVLVVGLLGALRGLTDRRPRRRADRAAAAIASDRVRAPVLGLLAATVAGNLVASYRIARRRSATDEGDQPAYRGPRTWSDVAPTGVNAVPAPRPSDGDTEVFEPLTR